MELNQILYNSKATHVKNAEKWTFYQVNLVFCLWFLLNPWHFCKFQINKKKVIFQSISDNITWNEGNFQWKMTSKLNI
jgi:hypothetical protein